MKKGERKAGTILRTDELENISGTNKINRNKRVNRVQRTNGRREGGSFSSRSRRIYDLSCWREVDAASRLATRNYARFLVFLKTFRSTFERRFDFDRPASRQRRRLPGSSGPRPVQRLHCVDSQQWLS